MKKFTITLFTFLLLSFATITLSANGQGRTLSQGIYNARDANLLIGTPITARIDSPNDKVIIFVIDGNQNIQELVRLGPQSTEHVLKPLDYGSSLIIFGNSNVTFS
jgi:hypothetical protein